jgi:hypothetical protein
MSLWAFSCIRSARRRCGRLCGGSNRARSSWPIAASRARRRKASFQPSCSLRSASSSHFCAISTSEVRSRTSVVCLAKVRHSPANRLCSRDRSLDSVATPQANFCNWEGVQSFQAVWTAGRSAGRPPGLMREGADGTVPTRGPRVFNPMPLSIAVATAHVLGRKPRERDHAGPASR